MIPRGHLYQNGPICQYPREQNTYFHTPWQVRNHSIITAEYECLLNDFPPISWDLSYSHRTLCLCEVFQGFSSQKHHTLAKSICESVNSILKTGQLSISHKLESTESKAICHNKDGAECHRSSGNHWIEITQCSSRYQQNIVDEGPE